MPKISELTQAVQAEINVCDLPIIANGKTLKINGRKLGQNVCLVHGSSFVGQWTRVAEIPPCGHVVVDVCNPNEHTILLIQTNGTSPVSAPIITLLSSRYRTARISKIRVVYSSTANATTYLEVYSSAAGESAVNISSTPQNFNEGPNLNRLKAYEESVEGSIPSGYSATEFAFPSGDFNLSEIQGGQTNFSPSATSGVITFKRPFTVGPTSVVATPVEALVSVELHTTTPSSISWRSSAAISALKWIAIGI